MTSWPNSSSSYLKYAQQEEKEIALFHSFSLLKEILTFLLELFILNVTKHVKCSAPRLSIYTKCSISLNILIIIILLNRSRFWDNVYFWKSGLHMTMLMLSSHFNWKNLPLANEIPFSLQTNLNVCQEWNSIFHSLCRISSFRPRRSQKQQNIQIRESR